MSLKNLICYGKAYLQNQFKGFKKMDNDRGQFALDIALGLAVVLVISAFIILPGLKNLSSSFIADMTNWWQSTMKGQIFRTTGN